MKDWECSSLTSHYRRVTVSNNSPGVSKIYPAVVKPRNNGRLAQSF